MNFKLKVILSAVLWLSQAAAFADNAAFEVSGTNPLDKKTEFINNHQIALTQIKMKNEFKKFVAVIPSMGSKQILVYENSPTTNELKESALFKEHHYAPFYITFDPSGKHLYAVSGTRNFISQYTFDAASKKFVSTESSQNLASRTHMQTACADNAIFNFDYFRTLQFFPSKKKAYITCEDLNGRFYVVGYQFNAETGALMLEESALWKENKQKTEGIVEKNMVELDNPLAVLIDSSGNFLYSVDVHNKLRQFKLNDSDQFALTGDSLVTDVTRVVSMAFDPAGKNIYLVARDGSGGSVIEQYKFDPSTGHIDKQDEVTIHNKPGKSLQVIRAQAAHIQFAPSGKFAYVFDNRSNVIYQYSVDPGTGNLTELKPATFASCFVIRSLVFDPDPASHFAYAAESLKANIKPQNEKMCEQLRRDPFLRNVDRLVLDSATGQLSNFVPR